MNKKLTSGIMIALLLAGMFVLLVNVQPVKANPGTKVVFRLLAIDGYEDSDHPNSAQHLIENLTTVGYNWQNTSWAGYDYVSYIHLLTNSTVKTSLQKYKVGSTTPANINSEMTNFLAATGAGESNKLTIRILYYNGHSSYNTTNYWFCCASSRNWRMLITDTKLASNLNSGDMATSNCTLIILDTCYAAGYFNKLGKPGRVILAACKAQPHESHRMVGGSEPTNWADFTGIQRTYFNGSYSGPVGIIGAVRSQNVDSNGDGWYSAAEVFTVANRTVIDYETSNPTIRTWNGVVHEIQIAQHYYGVVGGGIPFVMVYKTVVKVDWNQQNPRYWQIINVTFSYNPNRVLLVQPPTYPWSMYHNNAAHTGCTTAFGPSTSLLWTDSFFDSFFDSIALADGCAFVGTLGGGGGGAGGGMYALDLADGRVLWNFTAEGRILSSPAVADGTVYFATEAGWIYALYEETGLLSWKFKLPTGESIVSSPCVSEKRVFLGSVSLGGGGGSGAYGRLYALNASSGLQLYNFTADSPIYSSPAVADGMVFFGTNGTSPGSGVPITGWMNALREETGELVWSTPLPGPIRCSPAVADGRVLGGTCSQPPPFPGPPEIPGEVFALNESNGSPLWSFPMPTGGVLSSPAVDGGGGAGHPWGIVGSTGGGVYAFNKLGSVVWMTPTDSIQWSSPAIAANGLVYIGTNTGIFLCLNETDGSQKWSATTSGSINASPSITDGHVLVSSMGGGVYCWGPSFPQHDIIVSKATVQPNIVSPGGTVRINYTAANVGNVDETCIVNLAFNTSLTWFPPETPDPKIFYFDTVTLHPGEHVDKTYTTTFATGNYTIIVMAEPVSGEINVTNNDRIAGTIRVSHSGALYVKPSFPDYAPNGMPDFDEKQDLWGPGPGTYTWCCPVAAANSLWWLDSEYESIMFANPVPPPTISDHFPLVTAYGAWDDHNSSNVAGLVGNLAFLMDTDGQRTHTPHSGTRWVDIAPGIQQYLIQQGVGGAFQVQNSSFPDFTWINNRTEACQDVELFLEFWQQTGGGWTNTTMTNPSLEFGHCVTSAGVDPATFQLLISDPYFDVASPFPPAAHNDAQFVSHDAYTVSQWMLGPGPYGPQPIWELVNYCQINMGLPPTYHAFIRGAVATFGTLPVPTAGVVGITGYKLVFKETMSNSLSSPVTIDYYWSFSVDKWNGTQWVASGISGSSTPVTGYSIPALSTVDLPYYVYVLPMSGSNAVAWCDWLRVNFTFHWTYSSTSYSAAYTAKLHVHPGDFTGAASVTFPYLGADGMCDISDGALVGLWWHQYIPPADMRVDINGDGYVDISDGAIIGVNWHKTWTNTPPP